MDDDEVIDMEKDVPPPNPVHPTYQYILDFPYETLPPQTALMLQTFLRSYDPAQPLKRRAQYCQMQLSHLPDGGGQGAAGVAQRRVMIRFENRVIGHNLQDHHFLDVSNDDRIKQKDHGSYPLPNQPTHQEKREYVINKSREMLNISPHQNFLPDLISDSPRKVSEPQRLLQGSVPAGPSAPVAPLVIPAPPQAPLAGANTLRVTQLIPASVPITLEIPELINVDGTQVQSTSAVVQDESLPVTIPKARRVRMRNGESPVGT